MAASRVFSSRPGCSASSSCAIAGTLAASRAKSARWAGAGMGASLRSGRGGRDLLAYAGKFGEVLIEAPGEIERRAVVGYFVGPHAAGIEESGRHSGTGFRHRDAKDGVPF